MENVLPKLKKKISSYISSETGRISKQSIITIGAFIGTAALATLATTKTVKAALTAELNPKEGRPVTLIGAHTSHSSGCGESCGGETCTADYECGTCMSVCQYAAMQDCGEANPCITACELACQGQGGCGQGECRPAGELGPCAVECQLACQLSCMSNCQVSCEPTPPPKNY